MTDFDITQLLEQLNESGNIVDNVENEGQYDTYEIDRCLENIGDPVVADITEGGEEKTPDVKKEESVTYDPEPEVDIDKDINFSDMLTLLRSEIDRKGIAGHHIDSVNSFNKIGIKQIITKVFTVDGRLRNQRDKTEEDKEISDIYFKVDFTDVNLTQPTTVKYKSGNPQLLTPNMARLKNLTYSSQMYVSFVATATAYLKDGSVKTRKAEARNHRFSSIPTCLGTELCHTYNQSWETLKNLEEDPSDHGGRFIINGGEWTVDNLENITNNTFHVYKNMYLNEIARGTFLSKPGDAFENSYQVILRYLNNGNITLEITTTKFDRFEVPYYLIFRALGMTRDKDIVNNIVYGINNTDPVTKRMLEILEKSFQVEDPKYAPIRRSTDTAEIIQFIASKINESQTVAAARKDENIAKYLNNSILNIVDRFIFPHIGTGVEHRIKKLRFLGHLINKLLRVEMGVLEPTDRDSYKNKRVFAAGTSLAKTFKTLVNIAIVQEVKKQLVKDFKSTPFSQVQLAESVKAAINGDDLERLMVQAITTGNKTITMKRNEITNRISSQTVYHKNDLNVKSTLNTINTPDTTANKQNERADEMRRVHPTYVGYVDVSQSADTGEKVGMTKQMACTASVCGSTSSFILKQILSEDPDIMNLDSVSPESITSDKLVKVFVNGDWIGCCKNSAELASKYRNKRRHEDIHHLTTIVRDPLIREVYFWTDVGRLMRPLIIVYSNIKQFVEAWRAGDKSVKYHQWTKLTKKHINGLKTKKLTMDDLRRERVIEYISPEEQENALIAENLDKLREYEFDLRMQYTHCDIDLSIFGIVTLASPCCNHSSAVRNTMYTNHRKQSAGWPNLNYPFLINKNYTVQHYCERPIVSAFTDSLTNPNGQNCIVALALYSGKNCEDSIYVNKSSVDRGLFNASFYNYEKAELEKNELFGNPDQINTMDIKKDASYEHVENGFIREGTIATKGDVLIVKTAKLAKPVDRFQYVDRSIVYKKDEPVYVEKVITTRNAEDALIAKVKIRSNRPLRVGDKLSSRTGNKGIVSDIVPACDMPYTEDGVTPDLVVNAHSIPTRMAVNQIIETVMAKASVQTGAHTDCTTFRKLDFDKALEILEKRGIKYGGHTRMYNGKTGEWIDTLLFIGPTAYQRLQKYVMDEHYAARSGPTSALTKQPLEGSLYRAQGSYKLLVKTKTMKYFLVICN